LVDLVFGGLLLVFSAALAFSVRRAMDSGRIRAGTGFIADRNEQPRWYWFTLAGRCAMALFGGTMGINITRTALWAMLGHPR
jgi:hypothetical protein